MAMPPVPPMGTTPGGPSNFPPPAQTPAYGSGGMTPNAMQVNGAAIRMAMEIDHALRLLGQAVPQLAPWIEKTSMELKAQLGQIASAPTSAASPAGAFPDGSSRL